MTLTAIIALIGSISTIVGGLVYIFKYSSWALRKTQAARDQDIAAKVSKEQADVAKGGRPKWDN